MDICYSQIIAPRQEMVYPVLLSGTEVERHRKSQGRESWGTVCRL